MGETSPQKPDRNLALELVRVTEAAALAAARWVGRGDKIAADQAAVDAMRLVLDSVSMDGMVVIGEGEKDEAPMLYNGEQIGDGSPPVVDIAVDPLEGTRLCALGMPSALAVIALAERGTMFDPGPCVYMEKMAGSEEIADLLDLDRPLPETLKLIAERKGGSVDDVTAVILDRPRHDDIIKEVPRGRRGRTASSRTATSPAPSRRRGPRARAGQRAVRHRRHARGCDRRLRVEVPRRCHLHGRLWPREPWRAPRRSSTPATTSARVLTTGG